MSDLNTRQEVSTSAGVPSGPGVDEIPQTSRTGRRSAPRALWLFHLFPFVLQLVIAGSAVAVVALTFFLLPQLVDSRLGASPVLASVRANMTDSIQGTEITLQEFERSTREQLKSLTNDLDVEQQERIDLKAWIDKYPPTTVLSAAEMDTKVSGLTTGVNQTNARLDEMAKRLTMLEDDVAQLVESMALTSILPRPKTTAFVIVLVDTRNAQLGDRVLQDGVGAVVDQMRWLKRSDLCSLQVFLASGNAAQQFVTLSAKVDDNQIGRVRIPPATHSEAKLTSRAADEILRRLQLSDGNLTRRLILITSSSTEPLTDHALLENAQVDAILINNTRSDDRDRVDQWARFCSRRAGTLTIVGDGSLDPSDATLSELKNALWRSSQPVFIPTGERMP